MNRLEKKCFIASTGLHLLLALILLVGPAFLGSQQKPAPAQYIEIIPANIIEGAFAGGGNPHAKPPAPSPPRRETAPAPPPEPAKPQKHQTLEEPKLETASVEPSESGKRKPQIDLSKTTTRQTDSKSKSKPKPREDSETQRLAKARADQAAQVRSALENLKEGLSSSTSIDIQGPGGEAYAGYLSVLQSIYQSCYDRELAAAGELAGKESTVIVVVTVERSGRVVNSRVSRPSGIAQLDRLVRRVLDQVDFIRAFPAGSKDSERTFTIGFELRLNRAIG